MDLSKILPIFIVIAIVIIGGYRISTQLLSRSAPRRTKIMAGISMLLGIIVVLILVGLQVFHIIP